MGDVRLRIIVGPTAAGKSRLALALAQSVGATIISADSRQVYRGFDIGTAKPSPNELALVPHVGIDIVEPKARFSAASFASIARTAIDQARRDRREVLVVGGTGFYVRALVQPLFSEPELDPVRREHVAGYLAGLTTTELRRWCERIDPPRSTLGRTQLLRALEVALLTGRRLSELFVADPSVAPITPQYLVVDPGATLHEAIERRVDEMIKAGWLDEVRRLSQSVPATAPAWKATGYDTLRRYVVGGSAADLSAARAEVLAATRQYAKRQRTWFRHQLHGDMLRINPNDSSAQEWALAWWHSGAQVA
ncbi:MAG: tRNA (adenosine(37)-N6)-dimethylallyltransferase MiaA [Gemmatimonadaceae bacterium]